MVSYALIVVRAGLVVDAGLELAPRATHITNRYRWPTW